MYVIRTEIWYSRKIKYVKILAVIAYFFIAFLVLLFFIIHLAGISGPPNVWPKDCDQKHQENCARLTNTSHFGIPDNYNPVTLETTKNGGKKNKVNLKIYLILKFKRQKKIYLKRFFFYCHFKLSSLFRRGSKVSFWPPFFMK